LGLQQIGMLAIATTDNRADYGYNYEPDGEYCKATGYFGFGGTSAAAAQVAGVIALMLEARGELKNNPDAIKNILKKTANKDALHPGPGKEFEHEFGGGLVDAAEAVKAAKTWEL